MITKYNLKLNICTKFPQSIQIRAVPYFPRGMTLQIMLLKQQLEGLQRNQISISFNGHLLQ